MKYWGLASANGLESFMWDPSGGKKDSFNKIVHGEQNWEEKSKNIQEEKKMAYQTASWNRHRHTVLYECIIDSQSAKEIQEMIRKDPEGALLLLKDKATKISLAKMPGVEKSWKLIPNKDLDAMT